MTQPILSQQLNGLLGNKGAQWYHFKPLHKAFYCSLFALIPTPDQKFHVSYSAYPYIRFCFPNFQMFYCFGKPSRNINQYVGINQ